MKCIKCSSENIQYPEIQSAMELRKCLDCGHEFYVHCLYAMPDTYKSKHKIYEGFHSVSSPLEAQKLNGDMNWELGLFLDIEVEKIEEYCNEKGIIVSFKEVFDEKNA